MEHGRLQKQHLTICTSCTYDRRSARDPRFAERHEGCHDRIRPVHKVHVNATHVSARMLGRSHQLYSSQLTSYIPLSWVTLLGMLSRGLFFRGKVWPRSREPHPSHGAPEIGRVPTLIYSCFVVASTVRVVNCVPLQGALLRWCVPRDVPELDCPVPRGGSEGLVVGREGQ